MTISFEPIDPRSYTHFSHAQLLQIDKDLTGVLRAVNEEIDKLYNEFIRRGDVTTGTINFETGGRQEPPDRLH